MTVAQGMELKIARIKARLSQQEVAALTGVERTRLSRIESGWLNPRPDELKKLKGVISKGANGGDRRPEHMGLLP